MSNLARKLFTNIHVFLITFLVIAIISGVYYHGRLTSKDDASGNKWLCACDFKVFWKAASSMHSYVKNSDIDIRDSEAVLYDKSESFYHFRYSPTVAYLMTPLSLIKNPLNSLYIWFLITSVFYVAGLMLLSNKLGKDFNLNLFQKYLLLWGIFFVSLKFYLFNLSNGQSDTITAFLFVLLVMAYAEKKELLCGVIIAATLQSKPMFASMLIYFLLIGRFRIVLTALLTFIAILFIPAISLGLEKTFLLTKNWYEILGMSIPSQLLNYKNQSMTYAISLSLLKNEALKNLFPPEYLFVLLGSFFTFVSYVALLFYRRYEALCNEKKYRYLEISLLLIIPLLFSPITWVAHFTGIFIPFAVLVCLAMSSKNKGPLLFLTSGAFIFLACIVGTDLVKFIPFFSQTRFINISLGALFLVFSLFHAYSLSKK